MHLRRAALGLAFSVFALTGAHAQGQQTPLDFFDRGATSIEFGLGLLDEAWNLNERREWLLAGSASLWWACSDRVALGAEFQHARVFQRTPDAFVQGFSPLVRFEVIEREAWRMFVEAGPGLSWSDLDVPPRGTKFNYLFQGSAGLMRRIGRNASITAAFRFFHLSNHFRDGRDHNPDLEALGAYTGLSVSF
jgi:hypothetical protein